MTYWKNKKTCDTHILLACAIDTTNERTGLPVIIYCPDDDGNIVYVMEASEFLEEFELINKESK